MSEQSNTGNEVEEAVDATDLLLNFPLYREVVVNDYVLKKLRYDGLIFDCFCVQCAKVSTFKTLELFKQKVPTSIVAGGGATSSPAYRKSGIFTINALCQRDARHEYSFFFYSSAGYRLCKVGQRPSLEDITGADLDRFRKVIDRSRFAELKRATGLASHGIGIGSFVYLRRIFEGLIQEHFEQAKASGIDIERFDELWMDQKVEALSAVLPKAMVEHSNVYKILSSGIHEMDEDTCKRYFPVIRQAIIMILEQDLQQKQEAERAAQLKRDIGQILGEVATKKK